VLLDADALLQTNSPSGICGEEFFYEHVHLNFRGNYLLARGWAEQIVSFLPPGERGSSAAEWASPENCERRLGLAGPNRGFVIQSVLWRLQRPPLSTQENNHSRTATLEKQLMESRQEKGAESVAAVKQFHEEAIQRSPVDLVLREDYARFLESIGDLRNATAQWRSVAEAMPHNCVASYQVGRLLALQGQWAEAETRLLQAVAQRPEMPSGWFQLGNVRLGQGKLEMALENYERAEGLDPADAIYCVFTGKVLSQMNRQTEAVARFQEALKLKPDCWEAHFALGDQLVVEDKIAEAQKEYEAVVHLQPGNSMAHLNIGVALARQGRMEAAQKEFEETLRLDPANKMAAMYRDRIVPPKRE
jgi:tetratricopeptide (TPR) repeat protein